MTDGNEHQCPRHGGTGGSESSFKLEDGEFISRIEGSNGDYVNTLTFFTNKGKYGPYGKKGHHPFEMGGLNGGGFFGRCGDCINAIGAYTFVEKC